MLHLALLVTSLCQEIRLLLAEEQEGLHKELQRPNKKVDNSLELQTVNVTIKISRVSTSLRNVQNRLYFLNPYWHYPMLRTMY